MRLDLVDPDAEGVASAVDALLEGQNIAGIARDLGVARETVYRWRRGESAPTLPELVALVRTVEGTVTISMNPQHPSLEDEVAELRRAVEGFYKGRALTVDIFEHLQESKDPRVQELLQRLRDLGFRD